MKAFSKNMPLGLLLRSVGGAQSMLGLNMGDYSKPNGARQETEFRRRVRETIQSQVPDLAGMILPLLEAISDDDLKKYLAQISGVLNELCAIED